MFLCARLPANNMKKILTVLIVLAVVACSKKKEQTKDLLITGNIAGMKKGALVIKRLNDTVWQTIDSVVFNGDSKFETEIDLPSPEMLSLRLDRGVSENMDNELLVFAEPGQMDIQTDLEKFYAKANVTGSKNNDLYTEYKKGKSRYSDLLLELSVAEFTAKKEGKTFSKEDNEAQLKNTMRRKYLYAINFARNHADHDIAPYIALYEVANAQLPYLDTINNALSPAVAKAKYGRMLADYIDARRKAEAAQ